ncbi:hypothetical protein ABFS83_10G054200 [Erythranthe nasuta]
MKKLEAVIAMKRQYGSTVDLRCAKRSFAGKDNDDDDDDRISRLPDDVLLDILSFLSLKEAARSSVLSSRWMNLWKHTPSLDFDAQGVLDKIPKHCKSEKRKFVKWVNSVVRTHKSPALKEFKIRFPLKKSSRKSITRWLEFAFSRRVQRLELDFDNYHNLYEFPQEFLLDGSMQPPSDSVRIDQPPRMLFDFKSLKALSLKSVRVSDGAIEFFLHNCPLLEQLIVHESIKLSRLEICGSSLKLKHLEIASCRRLKSLKVSAPRLTALNITRSKGLLLENVPLLVNACVSCGDASISIENVFSVLSCCVSQLQTLSLDLSNIEIGRVLDEISELPLLPKLKKLVIKYCGRGHESLIRLTALLRVSPFLEEFFFQFHWYILPREDRQVKIPISSPHHHLKVFKFCGYYGSTNDVELISYILENCPVLEKIIIDLFCVSFPVPQVPKHVELVIL